MFLKEALKGMDIPENRLELGKIENIRWLSRNLMIRNSKHKNFNAAMQRIRLILQINRFNRR